MRRFLASILVVVSTVIVADAAMACSCAPNPTAERILEGAAAVFTGIVEESLPVTAGRSITTFTVVESFKAVAAGAILRVLHPSGSSASCGVTFLSGQTYTLAVHRIDSDPGLTTSLCSAWMFMPQVGTRTNLIERMRALRQEQ